MMSLLFPGITGFDTDGIVPWKDFKHAVYVTVQTMGNCFVSTTFEGNQGMPNFHQINVTFPHKHKIISVICNNCHPIVAFVDGGSEGVDLYSNHLKFMNHPELQTKLEAFGFTIYSTEILNSQLSDQDFAALSAYERKEAVYYRPLTIGGVIFNYWD